MEFGAVAQVAENAATGLQFGDAGQSAGDGVGARPAAADDLYRQAGLPAPVGGVREQADCAADSLLFGRWIGNSGSLALPGHDAAEQQGRIRAYRAGQGDGGVAGGYARALQPYIYLDDQRNPGACGTSRCGQQGEMFRCIDRGDHPCLPAQCSQPLQLTRCYHRAGNQYLLNARSHHGLGFGNRGAGDAPGTSGDQARGERWRANGLDMGAPKLAPLRNDGVRHVRDVALEDLQVQNQERRFGELAHSHHPGPFPCSPPVRVLRMRSRVLWVAGRSSAEPLLVSTTP